MIILGTILIISAFIIPNFIFGISIIELFKVITAYLKTNTHTLIDTALFQSSASILMTCILFFFVGALLIITGYIINKQPIDKTKIKNTLNWKEEYKNEELNIKIINELENAHAAVQELRQQIEELKKRENGTN